MRSRFAELLAALAPPLHQLGVGWYLFGAQAAMLHGAERLTADVDVTVHLGIGILRARRATLNVDLVRSTLSLLEQALDQSDLMPAFEGALGRTRR